MENYNPYLDMPDGDDFGFKGWDAIFDETFLSYVQLLVQRTNRLSQLDLESLDYQTYTDMCLVMIRALLIESERLKDNYTLQNFLTKHEKLKLAEDVNEYIEQPINKMMTVRDALKISVDKFIAHNDTMTFCDAEGEMQLHTDLWFKRGLFMKDIRRKDYPFSIAKITAYISSIVSQIVLPEDRRANPIAYGK